METANPAGRLHEILARAQSATQISGRSNNAVNLWAGVFEVETEQSTVTPSQTIVVISRLLQLKRLIEETEDSLKKIEGLPDRYFRPFERIRPIPDQSLAALNQDITGPIRAVTEGDMTVLEFCSERLEERHAEPIIDEEELQSILADVTALFDEVKAGDLDPELKTFILDGLESIRRGIYEFRIRGPQRLKEAVAEIIASFVMNHEIAKTSEDQESWERFNKTFRRFVAAVSFAHSGMKLLQVFTGPFLPSASDATHQG
jgi:hypothetical protein